MLFLLSLAICAVLGWGAVDVPDDGNGTHALDGELEVSL